MLKDQGTPLAAVACEEAPGWKWQDVFTLEQSGVEVAVAVAVAGKSVMISMWRWLVARSQLVHMTPV
jgi:hypothetical protein